ncbi:hypothetical protein Tdes44962_MAKER05954 [Teratosphaeria destructans]|uniref:Uncharacterized protein n=1 Tax=Teratosphaeria destructans TaxID=418781 RepID=A0A9W7SIN6_9PEZI|nr:hypothetical protein Tdes44962_MAKER05954 [Teratosphaeria destructans]
MRFIGGFAVPDRQTASGQQGLKHFDSHLSLNTDLLLGGKQASRLREKSERRRQHTERAARDLEFWADESGGDYRGYKSLEAKLKSQDLLLGTRERTVMEMQMARNKDGPPRLTLWPELEGQSQPGVQQQLVGDRGAYTSASDRAGSRDGNGRGAAMRASSSQEYYDPAREPLYVSQQTSASAVRDMGLRKSLSNWKLYSGSEPMLASTTSLKRPLKSAMKKSQTPVSRDGSSQDDGSLSKVKTSGSEKKPRRLDLSQFFPQQRGNGGQSLRSSDKTARPPSVATDASESLHQHRQYSRRPTLDSAVSDSRKRAASPAAASIVTTRTKVFDDHILDPTKKNVRRPPKGIQNWFDGFEISSDEDEHVSPSAQREGPPPPPTLQELPAEEKPVHGGDEKQTHGGQPLPSTFSPWQTKPTHHQPTLSATSKTHKPQRSTSSKNSSNSDRIRMLAVAERQSFARQPPSRLALSRLTTQSVLSLSDSDGDENSDEFRPAIRDSVDDASIIIGSASKIDVHRIPISPPRQLHSYQRAAPSTLARTESAGTVQTSGSIPIRLTGSQLPSIPYSPSPRRSSPIGNLDQGDYNEKTLRRLEGRWDSASQATPSVRSRAASKVPTDFETAYTRAASKVSSADVESLYSARTGASSTITEGAHLMQVTEDEMQLLEMIRQRRATKAKDSFAEGYQLALKKEHEALIRRRQSAQQTALQLLSLREEKLWSREGRSGRRESSNTGSSGNALSNHSRTNYNLLKEEEVDQTLKLQRFLAAHGEEIPMTEKVLETPLADKFPDPPSRKASYDTLRDSHRHMDGRTSRSRAHPSQPQQFELLLPDTYSPVSERAAPATAQIRGHGNRRSASEPPAKFVHHGRGHSAAPVEEEDDHCDGAGQYSASSQIGSEQRSPVSPKTHSVMRTVSTGAIGTVSAQEPKQSRRSTGLGKIIAGLKLSIDSEASIPPLHESVIEEVDGEPVAPTPATPPPRNPLRKSPGEEASNNMPKAVRPDFHVDTALANEDRSALPSPLRPLPRTDSCEVGPEISPSIYSDAKREFTNSPAILPATRRDSSSAPWTNSTSTTAVDTKAPTEGGASDSSATSYSHLTSSLSSASSRHSVYSRKPSRIKPVAQPPRLDTIMGNHRTLGNVMSSRASVCSYTSASEEVLAGWAELGGVRDVVAMRGRKGR